MTARIDTYVKATLPVPAQARPGAAAGAQAGGAETDARRAQRQKERTAREARWRSIREAGGIDAWVKAQLREKGLSTEGLDPSTLTDRERGAYKAKKKAEADERRRLRRLAFLAYGAAHITHLGAGIHWEDDPDVDRFDLENRQERARDNGLPELKGAEDLAQAMGLSVSRLRFLTYHREADTGTHYYTFTIPKRDGSARTLRAPKRELKAAQRWMLRQVAERLPVHSAAHGFLPERSIVTNAAAHAGAHTIVKLDIRDFFPTVTWRRVKGLLRKGGLAEPVATLLSLLSTESPREVVQFRGKTLHVAVGPRALPQGAPTSPALTNALCMRLDQRMSGLSRTLGCRYTRYADDLAFSWGAGDKAGARAPVGALLRGARQILEGEGFALHPDKTRVLRRGQRQKITGLVVNQVAPGGRAPAARVPRDVQRRLRAALYNREQGKPGREGETLAELKGMAAFIHMTDPARGRAFLERVRALEVRAGAAADEAAR